MASRAPDDSVTSTTSSTSFEGVLIVGGGYAGLHAARTVKEAGRPVAVLDEKRSHDFTTRLAGVAAGSTPVANATHQLDEFVPEVVIGSLSGVGDGEVTVDDGRKFTADAVIVTAGSRPIKPPIDGIEHALPLRSAAQALTIRAALQDTDSVVIIGGGATGVQLSAAIADHHPDLVVHIVDSEPRLLGPMNAATADGAQRILEQRGVHVHLESSVDSITADGVEADGARIDGLVLWAGGFEARANELDVDVREDGRILVEHDLRVLGMKRTFAAGDIAAHLDRHGNSLPMSAQIAVQAGAAAGANAVRLLDGEALEAPTLVQRGWVLELGGGRGLAEFGPVGLTSPLLDLIPPHLHKAIDLKTLFGIGGFRALRW